MTARMSLFGRRRSRRRGVCEPWGWDLYFGRLGCWVLGAGGPDPEGVTTDGGFRGAACPYLAALGRGRPSTSIGGPAGRHREIKTAFGNGVRCTP